MNKKGHYLPQKKYNPAAIAASYKKVVDDLKRKTQEWEMEKAGIRNHFAKITNFTSHDVKNAIQNMDAVISTLDTNNVTEEQIETIKNCLISMRISLDNFYRLSFEGKKIDFHITELAKLVELLNKASCNESKIKLFQIIDENEHIIKQPFHSILQVLNNLIINSITAFPNDNIDKKILIKYGFDSQNVLIEVSDNAILIPTELREKIFEIYYSTTGGSGIGLAHSKHIIESLKGNINFYHSDEEYCTNFKITFPIKADD